MAEKLFREDLISVITPVYNVQRYIGKTIDSILGQTFGNFEIILVDDYSKDESAAIIKQYCDKYPNIIYYRQEKNMGAAVARNKALEVANGRYVAFLDSDDLWLPEKLEKQMKLMKNISAPMTYTAIEMIDENNVLVKPKRKVRESVDYLFLLHNTMIATSSVIVDRKQLGDFRMPLRRSGQDYATWLMLLRNGAVAYGIDEALVRYRVGNKSLSSNKLKSIKQVWEIQTQDEGINKLSAGFNVLCFCFNAFKKYFM